MKRGGAEKSVKTDEIETLRKVRKRERGDPEESVRTVMRKKER